MNLTPKLFEIGLYPEKFKKAYLIKYHRDGSIEQASKLVVENIAVTYPKVYIETSENEDFDLDTNIEIRNSVRRRYIREAVLDKVYGHKKYLEDFGDRKDWLFYKVEEFDE